MFKKAIISESRKVLFCIENLSRVVRSIVLRYTYKADHSAHANQTFLDNWFGSTLRRMVGFFV